MNVTFVLVVLARVLIPLGIPRFPVPAILASLVVDAVDQTVFQTFGGLPADYQSYDKALDVYYLVIAYSATMRNWTDPFAFGVGRFLWYYRLIGVVAFELSGTRALLLIFPNTFEYFFIAYEVVRLRWDPTRLGHRAVIGLAAGIWIFVKLPQEWWIHIAELDVTEEMGRHGWILPSLLAAIVLLIIAVVRLWPRLPAPDWGWTVDADAHRPERDIAGPSPAAVRSLPFAATVAEKTFLVGLIAVIFAKVLNVRSTHTQVVFSVAIYVFVNAAVSQYFARRGTRWRTTAGQFAAMVGINGGAVLLFTLRRAQIGADVDPENALIFLLLLSLVITLYDRYRTMRERRLDAAAVAADAEALSLAGL